MTDKLTQNQMIKTEQMLTNPAEIQTIGRLFGKKSRIGEIEERGRGVLVEERVKLYTGAARIMVNRKLVEAAADALVNVAEAKKDAINRIGENNIASTKRFNRLAVGADPGSQDVLAALKGCLDEVTVQTATEITHIGNSRKSNTINADFSIE